MSMNAVSQVENAVYTDTAAGGSYAGRAVKNDAVQKTAKTTYGKTKSAYGNVVGTPELSEKAQNYYDQLKAKYSNMDFVLVSRDKIQEAQMSAGAFSKPGRTVVLIDEDKIERMAEDESYREKYEAIIENGDRQLAQMQTKLKTLGNVTSFGMQVQDDGKVSFFAVVDKSLAAQRERIEKKTAQKKADQKKAEKEAESEQLEESREKRKAESEKRSRKGTGTADTGRAGALSSSKEDPVTVTASSIEELLRKINDVNYSVRSSYVRTEEELRVGQHIDFRG